MFPALQYREPEIDIEARDVSSALNMEVIGNGRGCACRNRRGLLDFSKRTVICINRYLKGILND